MILTKTYYLNDDSPVDFFCDCSHAGYDESEHGDKKIVTDFGWEIDEIKWDSSRHDKLENDLISLYLLKFHNKICADFFAMKDEKIKEAIDDYWESKIP